MDLKQKIRNLSEQIHPEVVEMRRHIHAHPELSFEEEETSAYVKERLQAIGIEVQSGFAGTGLVGLIHGEKSAGNVGGKTIALRADMDALPITEANEVSYRSTRKGVMHACGHDVHTSSLLGTARILNELRTHFSGTVKLIFQPAEERVPGGASLMIRDGALERPHVEAIFGQHVLPYLEAGKVGIRSGMYMASADEIYIRVKGKGGHAAHPATFVDPIAITAQILVGLQQVVSRADPRIPSVLSFGTIRGEGATNIIPDEVYVEGTFRTMDETWRAKAHQKIESIIQLTAEAFGATAEVEIRKGYPVLHNDEALSTRGKQFLEEYVGKENVVDLDLWMAAEDFAWYTHVVPGCFYRLGTRNEARGIVHGLHTPLFDIDEEALRLSAGLMAWMAIRELGASGIEEKGN